MDGKNPVQSAERIFQLMELLSDTGAAELKDLSCSLGLHKSTVHRLLHSLICMGYVLQDSKTGKYMLTFKIVEISGRVLERTGVLPIAHPYVTQLAESSGETAHLVQRIGETVVYIDKVEPKYDPERSIRMSSQVGLARPMYCSGVGKAIMAELLEEEVKEIWNVSHIEQKTHHTIINWKDMKRELLRIREAGYAVDNEENELGVRCVAVCVKDYSGIAKYAMSVSAPAGRMDDIRLFKIAGLLLQAKQDLSKNLGYLIKNDTRR